MAFGLSSEARTAPNQAKVASAKETVNARRIVNEASMVPPLFVEKFCRCRSGAAIRSFRRAAHSQSVYTRLGPQQPPRRKQYDSGSQQNHSAGLRCWRQRDLVDTVAFERAAGWAAYGIRTRVPGKQRAQVDVSIAAGRGARTRNLDPRRNIGRNAHVHRHWAGIAGRRFVEREASDDGRTIEGVLERLTVEEIAVEFGIECEGLSAIRKRVQIAERKIRGTADPKDFPTGVDTGRNGDIGHVGNRHIQ